MELLVVIAITGALASVVIASVQSAKDDARNSLAARQILELAKALQLAKETANLPLKDITGTSCSRCSCPFGEPQHTNCINRWEMSLDAIETLNTGVSVAEYKRDPWGNPFSLNENEGEGGGCTEDHIRSFGKDGTQATSDDVVVPSSYILNITPACR